MPANDIYELSVDAIYGGENMTTVIHWTQIGSDGTGDARSALNEMWVALFDTKQRGCQVGTVVHFQQRIRRLFPTQTQSLIVANSGNGGVSGLGLPTNQCAILRMYGDLSGRRGIGHQKMYGVANQFVRHGRVSISFRDLMQQYGDVFKTDSVAGGGYKFRAGILGVDNVLRKVQKVDPLAVIKQIHSRSANVGI